MKTLRYLITGGAGFIGSAVVRGLIEDTGHEVFVVDKLTYAGNVNSLASVSASNRFSFEKSDICDPVQMADIFARFQPHVVMHLAAESHVDRSIDAPGDFIQTNIVGTYNLLNVSLGHWNGLSADAKRQFRFHHISTDEVYGSLGEEGLFREDTPYAPTSPYSASKAASDHLVRAWHHTYKLPVVLTNCSNNYGPFHFPEKLIPLTILNALEKKPISVYGRGDNIRDWLYVEDHARALIRAAEHGELGESYNIGGWNERRNIDVVRTICAIVDELAPDRSFGSCEQLIQFVTDRPGHDQRYAIDASKIEAELGWKPVETFETGIRKTVQWYLDNRKWWSEVRSGVYRGQRLGELAAT